MKPENIFLVRHGQSTGNADKSAYADTPDYALTLTAVGKAQAISAGQKLQKIIGENNPIQFYVSPFWRTRETFIEIQKFFPQYKFYEDPRLREQEWGQNMETREGYKEKVEEYRDQYGHFYYRFRDGGESCADVFDRISDFLDTLFRDFKKPDFPKNVIIVTHGMTMRLFIMRWFHCSVEEFESWANPKNCEFLHLKLNPEDDKYRLLTLPRLHEVSHKFQFNWNKTECPFFGFPKLGSTV